MKLSELLAKLDQIPPNTDVFIADKNITQWPIQIPIEDIEYCEKQKTIFLVSADTQSLLPGEIVEKLVYPE